VPNKGLHSHYKLWSSFIGVVAVTQSATDSAVITNCGALLLLYVFCFFPQNVLTTKTIKSNINILF